MPKPLFRGVCASSITPFHPDPDRQCQLLQATHGAFSVYAGIDTAAFEGLCHGSHGWISGIPSTVPAAARRLYELIAIEGNLPEARTLWQKLAPLMRLQFQAYHSKGEGAHWFSTMKAALKQPGNAALFEKNTREASERLQLLSNQ